MAGLFKMKDWTGSDKKKEINPWPDRSKIFVGTRTLRRKQQEHVVYFGQNTLEQMISCCIFLTFCRTLLTLSKWTLRKKKNPAANGGKNLVIVSRCRRLYLSWPGFFFEKKGLGEYLLLQEKAKKEFCGISLFLPDVPGNRPSSCNIWVDIQNT